MFSWEAGGPSGVFSASQVKHIPFRTVTSEKKTGSFFPSLCPFCVSIKLLLLSPIMTASCKVSLCVVMLCWIILENCFPEAVKTSRDSSGPVVCGIALGMCSDPDTSAPLHLPFAAVWVGLALPLMW